MNDSTRQPRARTQEAAPETPASSTGEQLSTERKVEVLQGALTALLARHKAMENDPAFVDAQRALNVVIFGVRAG